MPDAETSPLQRPLTDLRGVGRERAEQLARLKLRTVDDLLSHRPRRYEDRRHCQPIAELQKGESALVHGTIVAQGIKRFGRGRKCVFEFILDDGTARLHCTWWNLPYMQNYFSVGDEVFVHGKPHSLKPRTMNHPETEVIESGEESSLHIQRIVPVYPLTEGIPQRWLRNLIWRTLKETEAAITEPHPEITMEDFPSRANAVHMLHSPEELTDTELARQRLALDELVDLQFGFTERRRKLETAAKGKRCPGDNRLQKPFLKSLGFKLTDAQTRVLRDIRKNMTGDGAPMRRLLQGDVGAGKTVVSACTVLMAIESGFETAIMAPTEILAEQHYLTFQKWFEPLGIAVRLQTGSRKSEPIHGRNGTITVGTHALIEDGFQPDNLGLVIIDEQHKFGVKQRERLIRKGHYPHLLVMTATPIPRTLGLTLYGDLDISVIDELPAGRGSIHTQVRESSQLEKVWSFMQEKLAEGRQAYVVYPRLEDSDLTKGLKAVVDEFERLRHRFPEIRFALLHGRMSGEEKSRTMREFAAGKVQVLMATSVVEVGLNVANATVMIIENAELFGLAQLHQLRGRIGRGAHDSYCILVSDKKKNDTWDRLQVLTETTDGFEIADADLRMRGPGEMLGREQSGMVGFKFANLATDLPLVRRARDLVRKIV